MMPPPNCSGRSAARPSSSAAAARCPSRVRCPRPSGKGSVNPNGSRPKDGEQLLHEGVLFLPPVAGGSHGRPPAECSLSGAPCYSLRELEPFQNFTIPLRNLQFHCKYVSL